MQNQSLISFEDLQEMAGVRSVNGVFKYCVENGIACLRGRNKVTTTKEAVNQAMGVLPEPLQQNDDIEV